MRRKGILGLVLGTLAACEARPGGGGPGTGGDIWNAPRTAGITFGPSGVEPRAVAVSVGAQVTFTNGDSVPHQVTWTGPEAPVPCIELNLPELQPGWSITTVMGGDSRLCRFFDRSQPENEALQGTVVVILGGNPSYGPDVTPPPGPTGPPQPAFTWDGGIPSPPDGGPMVPSQ